MCIVVEDKGQREYDLQDMDCTKETHIKRQATRHDCLPSLLDYGDKRTEIYVRVRKKNILYWAD